MTLHKWISTKDLKHRQAAKLLGVPLWTLRNWLRPAVVPSTRACARIEFATDGAVTLRDWCPEAYQ